MMVGEVKGDSCGWNMKSLTLTTGIEAGDVLYASFGSEVIYHQCSNA